VLKLLLILGCILFFAARLMPRMGKLLGEQARKPFRQAKWMWSWVSGDEAEAIAAEREYGREFAREFAAQFPQRATAERQQLVSAVGAKLAESVKARYPGFEFTAVASREVNAYALPGGFVFVTEPLLNLCEADRDEIAFFLGHEMAHVLLGHAREQFTASAFLNAVTARLSRAGPMLRELLRKGYSRDLEFEADGEGAKLARAAGFEPFAGIRVLRRLAARPGGEGFPSEYFSSHPPYEDRIRKLETPRTPSA
jgi:predicted Zn-dependent protease